MQVIIHTIASNCTYQALTHEWYGRAVAPAFFFRFDRTEGGLKFSAGRQAPANVHPDAKEGGFHENLWQYDTAEFFLSTPDGSRYLEFNLNPTGAWWCRVFRAPRVGDEAFEGFQPAVVAKGQSTAQGWACEALLPAAALEDLGISLESCRLAATAILESPDQIFLTTGDTSGEPDFHRPTGWEEALLS